MVSDIGLCRLVIIHIWAKHNKEKQFKPDRNSILIRIKVVWLLIPGQFKIQVLSEKFWIAKISLYLRTKHVTPHYISQEQGTTFKKKMHAVLLNKIFLFCNFSLLIINSQTKCTVVLLYMYILCKWEWKIQNYNYNSNDPIRVTIKFLFTLVLSQGCAIL